jgi:hypothetical protein
LQKLVADHTVADDYQIFFGHGNLLDDLLKVCDIFSVSG